MRGVSKKLLLHQSLNKLLFVSPADGYDFVTNKDLVSGSFVHLFQVDHIGAMRSGKVESSEFFFPVLQAVQDQNLLIYRGEFDIIYFRFQVENVLHFRSINGLVSIKKELLSLFLLLAQ